jgi:deferrochelatase/peroxidase EfeB
VVRQASNDCAANKFGRWLPDCNHSADDFIGEQRKNATPTNPPLGKDPQRNNDFDYSTDAQGRQVPFGCHMRRMNPRDSQLAQLTDVNLHRIIRRSTTYGAPYEPNALSEEDDEVPRGVYFLFISAKAMATLEFLQGEWINNGNFAGVGDERDPMVGLQPDGATFSIPQAPARAGFTASRLSTFFAEGSICSCRTCRHCGGSRNFLESSQAALG